MKKALKEFLAKRMVGRKRSRQPPVDELERLHLQPGTPGFNDSIYFAGWQQDGLAFVTRQAFRSDKPNENWLKVHLPEEGVWGFENLPLPAGKGFVQGPLRYHTITPGKAWELTYEGPVFREGKEERLRLEVRWEGIFPIIDFDREGALLDVTARRIAAEPWNREFFRKLRELHKVHYEQTGRVTGRVEFRGKEYRLEGEGVRDHSFGRRNWQDWERHIWFLGVLDDGRCFNVSIIDYAFIKDLQAGYLGTPRRIETLEKIATFGDLSLENPLPTQLDIPVTLHRGEKAQLLSTHMTAFFPFVMDGTYHIRQALAHFSFDGVHGMGIAEMGINLEKYGDGLTH